MNVFAPALPDVRGAQRQPEPYRAASHRENLQQSACPLGKHRGGQSHEVADRHIEVGFSLLQLGTRERGELFG